jgi:adenylate cyclase
MSPHTRRLVVRIGACLAISALLAGLTALLASMGALTRFEGLASDQSFPRGQADPSIAVVGLDARALEEVDPDWPWPREKYAELVGALRDAGARLIVFDIDFVSKAEGDADLAQAMQSAGNVVLGTTTLSSESDSPRRSTTNLQRAKVVKPVDSLANAAVAVAQTQVTRDGDDGVVREVPLVVETPDGQIVPGLSLAALAAAAGQSPDPIIRRPSGVQIAGRAIPTTKDYDLRVSYPPELDNAKDLAVVSAADVMNNAPNVDVKDKIVFVGVTDVSLGDRLPTPVSAAAGLPGVLVHASALDTMLSRAYLVSASTLETVMWVLLISLILTFSVQFLPAWIAGLVALGTLAGYVFGAYLRVDAGTIMNLAYPTIAVALAVPLSGVVRYLVETRQRRRVDALFSQYVPARVAAQLIDEGRVEAATEGQRVDVTAMFCDLRGFTERSAQLEPAQVHAMLNDFYEYGSAIVLEHGGTLMTYIGDEIFVIFGAPVPRGDHATAAVACARELQESIEKLDTTLEPHGFAPLRFGIGLHAGEVVASHTGSRWRRQYTAIGSTVNLASRLCGRAGPGQVTLSESVRALADPPPPVAELPHVDMKGVRPDFEAYKLLLEHPPSGSHDR